MSRSPQKAAAASSLLILFFAAGLPACGALLATIGKTRPISLLLLAPSAGFSYYLAFDAPYKLMKPWFWGSVGFLLGISGFCLILASLIAPRCWQERAAGGRSQRWRELWNNWHFGWQAERLGFRRQMLRPTRCIG